ncbi:hypothetical protein ACWCYZ_12270 [Streptomyces virginiae]
MAGAWGRGLGPGPALVGGRGDGGTGLPRSPTGDPVGLGGELGHRQVEQAPLLLGDQGARIDRGAEDREPGEGPDEALPTVRRHPGDGDDVDVAGVGEVAADRGEQRVAAGHLEEDAGPLVVGGP